MMINTIRDNLNLWGFTPNKLLAQLNNSNAPKVLANSIPKSGTHLLERLLYLLPTMSRQLAGTFWIQQVAPFEKRCARLKKGQFLVSHLYYSAEYLEILEKHDIRPILLIRDPRDIVISNANYITHKNSKHRLHNYFVNHLKNDKERLHFCIKGSDKPHEYSIAELLEKFYPWMQSNKVLIIRFKDIIGEKGGGTAEQQIKLVNLVLNFIGIQLSNDDKSRLIDRLFHPRSKTFNKGRINQWVNRFDEEDKRIFKETAGNWLIKYGYEKDFNW